MKNVLLISSRVMHYRVSIYNYFFERFRTLDYNFVVRSDELQKENPYPIKFDFQEAPFGFFRYRREVLALRPSVVILFLHLKGLMIFPLIHWLRCKKIPVIFWTKGANLDEPDSRMRAMLFHYIHNLATGIILYSPQELGLIKEKNRHKVTFANNTVNYYDYPVITASRDDIKREFHIPFKKVALFVGRMDASVRGRKKADHAIAVFRTLENPDYGLVLVGSGMSEELKRSLDPRNMLYLGEIYDPDNSRISQLFRMADVFLMPGHVGLSLNQAFYWGLPVVTEEGNQPPEFHTLVDGRNGYVVKDNDLEALKARVVSLLEDDATRRRFGENARTDLRANASIEGMFDGFLTNIQRIESRRQGPTILPPRS